MAGETVIVEVEKGKKFDETGEMIANYSSSRRCWHIVFLPRKEWGNLKAGQKVRVNLVEIREDRAGRMMYRGIPADPEYKNVWRDNQDGTVSQITLSTNWLMEESEEGVCETRTKVRQDGEPEYLSKFLVIWGASLSQTIVRVTTIEKVPEIQEMVVSNELVERIDGYREVVVETAEYPAEAVEAESPGYIDYFERPNWLKGRLGLDYKGLFLKPKVYYQGGKSVLLDFVEWNKLISWLAEELARPYPVCACARERVDMPAGKSTCAQCEHESLQVALVDEHLPPSRRQVLVDQALSLLKGKVLDQENGEPVVSVIKEQTGTDEPCQGYAWYYVVEKGVYGSKFDPNALQILTFLAQASGKGLLRLAAWVAGGNQLTSDCKRNFDFYYRTQVMKSDVPFPDHEQAKLAKASVADLLIDLEAHREHLSEQARLDVAEKRGEILRNFEALYRRGGKSEGAGWVVQPDGSCRGHDRVTSPHYERHRHHCWDVVKSEELAVSWYCDDSYHDPVGSSLCMVDKLPVNGLTPGQLYAVEKIEDEIGMPRGSFGFHPEITRRNEQRLEACEDAALLATLGGRQIIDRIPDGFTMQRLMGDGVYTYPNPEVHVQRYVDWNSGQTYVCDNREAFLIHEQPVADGRLLFLVYDKYGSSSNLGIQWRKFEKESVSEVESDEGDTTLADLISKFNGN